MHSHFNTDHWSRVQAARAAQGLPVSPRQNERVPHALVGARLKHQPTGATWAVLEVQAKWREGSYLEATLANQENPREVRTCVVACFTCSAEFVLAQLMEFHENYCVI